MDATNRRFWHSPYFWILSVFFASRAAYFAAGVRFDATPLTDFFQIADPLLMKTRLFETLLYLHTQPPGFNLIIGIVLKLFPDPYVPAALHVIYLGCGFSLCFTLYRLMRILGVRSWVAATLTSIFLASPGVVLFENFLMYEYLLMALLCASAVFLERVLRRPDMPGYAAFFACLVTLMYLRAIFHLAWFLLIAGFVLWLVKVNRRQLTAIAAVSLGLVLAMYVKNQIIIGQFTASTWMGFNMETIAIGQLSSEEHERLIQSGLLSPLGRISTIGPLKDFQGLVPMPPPTGIPVLDQQWDSTGRLNFNNIGYLSLHPITIHDGKQIILHYPKAYLRSVVRAWFAYFLPTGDFTFFKQNRPLIAEFDRAFNTVFFGQWKEASNRKDLRKIEAAGGTMQLPLYTGTYLLIGLPALFCWGVWRVWNEARAGRWKEPKTVLLTYLLFQIGFMTAIVNFLSCYENNRYRLPIDPFFVVLLGMAIERIINGVQSRSTRTSPSSS